MASRFSLMENSVPEQPASLLDMYSILATVLLASAPATGENWTDLFNGHNLNGWVNVNGADSTWRAEDGMIRCTGKPTC